MEYGICHLSVIPCRAEPSDKSEMVTQLLFGETLEIKEELPTGWIKIITYLDQYECWVDTKQFLHIDKKEFDTVNKSSTYICSEIVTIIKEESSNNFTPILIGSSLPKWKNNKVSFKDNNYSFDGEFTTTDKIIKKENTVEYAYSFLGTPYLWGGRSPFGIDCSGFVQIVYKLSGIILPRDASQQAKIGKTLGFIAEAEPGDLLFFDNEEGEITHVGILLENHKVIHASGKVRIDSIDQQGIFNKETTRHTHQLRLIKSFP